MTWLLPYLGHATAWKVIFSMRQLMGIENAPSPFSLYDMHLFLAPWLAHYPWFNRSDEDLARSAILVAILPGQD